MMRDDTADWGLLERYVAGDCSVEEQQTVADWIAASPEERHALVSSLQSITGVSQIVPTPVPDSHHAWARLDARLAQTEHDRVRRSGVAERRSMYRSTWGVMVTGLVLAMVAGGDIAYRVLHHGSPQMFREFVTPAEGRASVVLRDGTQLILGPATRLRIPADFGRSTRAVTLDGEALFTVVHDAVHPFSVTAGGAVIHDVGTVFDVRAYSTDAGVQVVVAEGEVDIAGRHLGAHDGASFANGQLVVRHDVDVADATAWMQGGLAFHDVPLSQVVRDIARRFGLRITVADSTLNHQLVTATFSSESADEILDEVTHAVGARYDRAGTQVVVRRRTGRASHEDPPLPHQALRTTQANLTMPQ